MSLGGMNLQQLLGAYQQQQQPQNQMNWYQPQAMPQQSAFVQQPMPYQQQMLPQQRMMDPTLNQQQAILSQPAPQRTYQPLITPETYQDFYSNGGGVSAGPVGTAPEVQKYYTPPDETTTDRPGGAAGDYGMSGEGPGVSVGGNGSSGGWGAVDLGDMSNMAPVTDAITGESEGAVGAPGGFAPGISGETFGGEGDSAGSPGGSSCVIATHAVEHGAFSRTEKLRAVKWCTANLHGSWWGEAFRRGYRYYGNKAINAGTASQHYEEFRDFVRFATGQKRNINTAKTFVWRSVQFFVTGLFLKG